MNPEAPTVSVVIPLYEGEAYIAEAIESVRSQTFTNLELIVVDDGSTDQSAAIVQKYATDPRVRYITHEENRGIAAARNTGIKNARGEYIAFLDQDDLWHPSKIEKQLRVFDTHNDPALGMVFTDRKIVQIDRPKRRRKDSRVPKNFNTRSRGGVIAALLLCNLVPMITVLCRKRCVMDGVGLLDESIRSGADDFDFVLRLALKYKIFHLAEWLAVRRVHEDNYTSVERLMPDDLKIIDRVLQDFPEFAHLRAQREGALYYQLGRTAHVQANRAHAKEMYRKSIRTNPRNMKSRAALMLCQMGPIGDGVFALWHGARSVMGK